jgi:hypothetical protein
MLLSDIIAALDDEAFAAETLIGLGDLPLLSRVRTRAEHDGVTLGEFATQAVETFANRASDDDWVSLIGVMGRSDAPGEICLKTMVEFALRPAAAAYACGHRGQYHHADRS